MRKIFIPLVVASGLIVGGCGSKAANNSNAVVANSNTVNTAVNSNATIPATPASDKPASYDPAKSPTDAYKAAYYARKSCDVPQLKKLFDKDVLDFLTQMGKMDNKSLEDMIKDMCAEPQADTDDSRNERIDGDKARVEYPSKSGEWRTMDFVKEDGVWKLTLPSNSNDKKKSAK